ncbi:MAG: hypothetical protein ACOZFS_06560 [Thermodesulfobacteriota bacterium]
MSRKNFSIFLFEILREKTSAHLAPSHMKKSINLISTRKVDGNNLGRFEGVGTLEGKATVRKAVVRGIAGGGIRIRTGE